MNADRLAPWYRFIEYAAYGRALERSRYSFLERLRHARRILMLGEGDGRALARLLRLAPAAAFDVIEMSAGMIALARARCRPDLERVHFHQFDARRPDWPCQPFDAVATFYFLDCFSEPEARQLIASVAAALEPGGLWLMTDFSIPASRWRRWHAQLLIAVMYRFFGLATGLAVRALPPIELLMRDAGLVKLEAVERRAGLIRSEIWCKPPRTQKLAV